MLSRLALNMSNFHNSGASLRKYARVETLVLLSVSLEKNSLESETFCQNTLRKSYQALLSLHAWALTRRRSSSRISRLL